MVWAVRLLLSGRPRGHRRTGVRTRQEETHAMVHFLFSRWPRPLTLLLGFVPVRDVIRRGMENGRGCLRGRGQRRTGLGRHHIHTTLPHHITHYRHMEQQKREKSFWEAYIVWIRTSANFRRAIPRVVLHARSARYFPFSRFVDMPAILPCLFLVSGVDLRMLQHVACKRNNLDMLCRMAWSSPHARLCRHTQTSTPQHINTSTPCPSGTQLSSELVLLFSFLSDTVYRFIRNSHRSNSSRDLPLTRAPARFSTTPSRLISSKVQGQGFRSN
jgi:hypothetical protein